MFYGGIFMTKQEKIEWDKLYSYLKELMGYGTDQALKKNYGWNCDEIVSLYLLWK